MVRKTHEALSLERGQLAHSPLCAVGVWYGALLLEVFKACTLGTVLCNASANGVVNLCHHWNVFAALAHRLNKCGADAVTYDCSMSAIIA